MLHASEECLHHRSSLFLNATIEAGLVQLGARDQHNSDKHHSNAGKPCEVKLFAKQDTCAIVENTSVRPIAIG